MGRAARLRRERQHADRATGSDIRLVNTSADYFADFVRLNAARCTAVVEQGSAAGRSLVIAGAGPSLADHADECARADDVWACNGALPWLIERGHRVTHGFTVNQTADIRRLWSYLPTLDYLVASTVHPEVGKLVTETGRSVRWFHNLVELPGQEILYRSFYPETVTAGAGLNAVTRALDVVEYMGYERITVIGADCCLRGNVMHVDGSTAAESGCSDLLLSGSIDGRAWTAQADLWITANWLVRMVRTSVGRIRLVGDTLPVALLDKPVAFLDRLPHSVITETGERVPFPSDLRNPPPLDGTTLRC